jgi:hypothetical protein
VARIGERRGAHRVLVGKSERKRPLPWMRNNIKMDLQGMGRKWVVDYVVLSQDRNKWWAVVDAVMDFRVT